MKKTLLAAALLLSGFTAPAAAVPIVMNYVDGPNVGFNDPTLGPARRAAMEYVADFWGARIAGTRTITVRASFQDLGGDSNGAILGSAGPRFFFTYTSPPPPILTNTFYPISQVRQFVGNLGAQENEDDIIAIANSAIDGPVALGSTVWYYGFDEPAPSGTVSFVRVMLHELGHGLGFLSNLDDPAVGNFGGNIPLIFDRLIQVGPNDGGANWANLTNAQRATQATGNNLFWNGPATTARNGGTRIQIFAPNPYQGGSSISHYANTASFGGVPELMRPFLAGSAVNVGTTDTAFLDMHYNLQGPTNLPSAALAGTPVANTVFNEGTSGNVTIQLTASSTAPITARLEITGLTQGVDFTITQNPITIAPGNTTADFVVNFIDNGTPNPTPRNFSVRVNRITGALFGTADSRTRSFQLADPVSTTPDWSMY